jgi:hypothetical protein
MKIEPGAFEFVAIALTLIRAATPPPALSIDLGNLISLQPFFSSSVMNSPFHVEAIIQSDPVNCADGGCESPLPSLAAEASGVNGRIVKT